jgi:serine/threonine protein kinase
MSLQLHVIAGPDAGKTLTVQAGPDLMLGRGPQSFYHVTDGRVSRAHCQVLLEGDRVMVICNGGSGGTLVNGKPVKSQALKLGDVVRVGDTELRLQMGDFPLAVALGAVKQAPAGPPIPQPSPDQLESLVGQTLAHYQIGPVVGTGQIGMVFQATDANDHRPVALKVLLPEFSKNDEEMQRFVRGMKTALPLKHPNIVRLYGAGKTGPYCWVAMEYVAGESLMRVIGRIGVAGMLDWRHAYRAAVHVGRALAYAHEHGIVHRNVTPTNILRDATNEVVKLGDLMLAKALEETGSRQITRPGELVGDVAYMSPERTRGETAVDLRSDLYGLGATVYALLTGRAPGEGKTLVEKVTRIRQILPEKPSAFQPSIPPRFDGVVMRLLAKHPNDRYQTAEQAVKELDRIGMLHGLTA